jgi:hypothetical protein
MSSHGLGFWLGSHAPKFVVNWYSKRALFLFRCPICERVEEDNLTGIRKHCQCGSYMELVPRTIKVTKP